MESQPTQSEAQAAAFGIGAEIRKRHAAHLRYAPDSALRRLLDNNRMMIAEFKNEPTTCARFIMEGPAALPGQQFAEIISQTDTVELLYQSMHEGESSPIERAASTEDDWWAFYDAFIASGGSDEEFGLILEPDPQHPALCGAFIRFMHVLADANFDGSDRLRAEAVALINES